MKLRTNFAVFIIFFGLAFVSAVMSKNWLLALIFTALGLLALYADNLRKK